MATYTTPLRIKLLADGEEPVVWGQSTNINLSTVLETAITGVKTIATGDVNYALTANNALPDDARNAILVFTGARTAIRTITAPNVNKTYTIKNSTTGGFGITISAGSGTTVTIPNGATTQVYCDGSTGFYVVSSTIPITDIAMNSMKLTGLAVGTAAADSVRYDQLAVAKKVLTASRSSDTILAASDFGTLILATSSFTQTITAAATLGAGWWLEYRNDGTGVITLDANASETIDGATTITLQPAESITLFCDGSNFKTIGRKSRVFVGSFTRLANAATGSQSITGVGFKPRTVEYMGTIVSTYCYCTGFSDGTTDNCITMIQAAGTPGFTTRAGNCIGLGLENSNFQVATTTSHNSDGFTLAFTKTGAGANAGTGTMAIYFRAQE